MHCKKNFSIVEKSFTLPYDHSLTYISKIDHCQFEIFFLKPSSCLSQNVCNFLVFHHTILSFSLLGYLFYLSKEKTIIIANFTKGTANINCMKKFQQKVKSCIDEMIAQSTANFNNQIKLIIVTGLCHGLREIKRKLIIISHLQK